MRTRSLLVAAVVLASGCKKDEPVKVAPVVAEAPKPAPAPVAVAVAAAKPDSAHAIDMKVTEEGFVPSNVALKANEAVTLNVTRTTEATCATELLIDGTDIKVALPLNTQVSIAYTPTKAGQVKFGCAMDKMVSGVLVVD